jgi:hypothetical protein
LFKKLVSLGTSVFIAVGLTIAGAALPAIAEDPAYVQDDVVDPSPPPTTDVQDDVVQEDVADPSPSPSATCDPDAQYSYAYFASDGPGHTANSGSITITGNAQPCQPLYVTAASWTFDGSTASPQHMDKLNKYTFDQLGTFSFTAPVNCGQGDIYASWTHYIVPPVGDLGVLHPPAAWEQGNFLHDVLAGKGPNPTFVVQTDNGGLNGNATCVIVPTLPTASPITNCFYTGNISMPADTATVHYVRTSGNGTSGINVVTATAQPGYAFPFVAAAGWTVVTSGHVWTKTLNLGNFGPYCAIPGDPSHSDQVCTGGTMFPGTITVGLETGLAYTLTGPATAGDAGPTVPVTTAVTDVAPGTYIIQVSALSGYTLTGAGAWPLTVEILAVDCDQVTLPAAEVNAFSTDQGCSVGKVTTGSVSVLFPLAQEADVQYTLDSTIPVPFAGTDLVTLAVSPGAHTVTATPIGVDGIFAAFGSVGVQNPVTGVVTFSLTVNRFIGTCGNLTTLAFTGRDMSGSGPALAGGGVVLLGFGILFLFMRRNSNTVSE